jgi:hypothetical protein
MDITKVLVYCYHRVIAVKARYNFNLRRTMVTSFGVFGSQEAGGKG